MTTPAQKVLRFGQFTLDPNAASLRGADRQLQLRPKSFDVLLYLARHPGRIVNKDELIDAIWPNIFVTDNSLVQCISDIRLALDDDAQGILKTVARRGYLFAAPVIEAEPLPTPPRRDGQEDREQHRRADGLSKTDARLRLSHAAILLACAAFAVAGTTWWWAEKPADVPAGVKSSAGSDIPAATPTLQRASIAVLPLATLSASTSDDYFADGLTEDIIAALGRFSELSVLSPKAVFPYKGTTLRPEDIGRELKVRYFAEGSVRRSTERIRVAIRLTDAWLGTLLWADQYDAEPESIFAIQDNITRHITGALAVRVTNAEQARVAAKPPSSLEAYDLVLRGRDFLGRLNRTAISNARTMFERAAELDPNYAAAYVGLGRVDLFAVNLGWTPDPAAALHRAESLARKAIGIDEANPAAHVLLGRIYTRLREYDRAVDALKRAIALNQSDPDSHAGLGDALLWSGDTGGAITALETAAQLDPKLSSEDLFNLGAGYFLLGDNGQAAQVFERTVARNDGNPFIYAMLAAIHAEEGRKEESSRAAAEVRRLNPFFDLTSFGSLFRNPEHRQKLLSALQKAGF
jgi:adenylate cyclase